MVAQGARGADASPRRFLCGELSRFDNLDVKALYQPVGGEGFVKRKDPVARLDLKEARNKPERADGQEPDLRPTVLLRNL